jgi:hypothetical protein
MRCDLQQTRAEFEVDVLSIDFFTGYDGGHGCAKSGWRLSRVMRSRHLLPSPINMATPLLAEFPELAKLS